MTWRALLVSLVAWLLVVFLHSAAEYSDMLRRNLVPQLQPLLRDYALAYAPWVLYTTLLASAMHRWQDRLSRLGVALLLLLGSVLLFYLPQVAWQVVLRVRSGVIPGAAFWPTLLHWPAVFWLIDFALMCASFAVVYAVLAIRKGLDEQRRKQAAESENLSLRLELEQQRLRGIRAQLEPHFLFNALNAISGLMRGDDRRLAIDAIGQLSVLLRYALTASQQDRVTLARELEFVDGYLALQRLRYGDRLQVTIDITDDTSTVMCPPLLLQPLVENAIRHDVERHEGASDIRLSVAVHNERVVVLISNALRPHAAPNPGHGLGLDATRDRMALLFGERGGFTTTSIDGRFSVRLEFPAHGDD